MDVLQTAVGVVGRAEAEEDLEFVIPCSRYVGDLQFTVEKASLDRESEKNVKVVSGLIGLYTETGVVRPVPSTKILIKRTATEAGEDLGCPRQPFFPEGAGASYVVFPET